MKGVGGNAKQQFVFIQQPSSLHKQGSIGGGGGAATAGGGISLAAAHHRLWLLAFVSFFTFASLLTLLTKQPPTTTHPLSSLSTITTPPSPPFPTPIPDDISHALLHYATASTATDKMPAGDVAAVAAALRRRAPCNLLVFGVAHEALLWRSLNRGGRTVFLDESEYHIARVEERHPGLLEAYDVAYTTRVAELPDLLAAARAEKTGDCRPVQNLLFSDCRLGINDLPNHLYDVAWDVILVDGPRGYQPASPGRMSAIFTAAVMARSGGAGGNGGEKRRNFTTDVFVHDYERQAERVCSEEFLCHENLVFSSGQLAHFAVKSRVAGAGAGAGDVGEFEFCANRSISSPAAIPAKS